jgi:hypothetical protein
MKGKGSKGAANGSKGLYPTVAISDAFNAALHLLAAQIAYEHKNYIGMIGFLNVALAASVGVLRFGFNEDRYASANGHLADLSAFVGLPCVGYSFFINNPGVQDLPIHPVVLVASLAMVEALSRSFPGPYREILKILVNLTFFVAPVAISSVLQKKWLTFGAITLFVIAGIVVKPERHQYLFGIRRENIFHYMIGIAAYFIAQGT